MPACQNDVMLHMYTHSLGVPPIASTGGFCILHIYTPKASILRTIELWKASLRRDCCLQARDTSSLSGCYLLAGFMPGYASDTQVGPPSAWAHGTMRISLLYLQSQAEEAIHPGRDFVA